MNRRDCFCDFYLINNGVQHRGGIPFICYLEKLREGRVKFKENT